MSDLQGADKFTAMVIALAMQLSKRLKKAEAYATESMIEGRFPRFVNNQEVGPKTYVAGALLLTLCGMVAENDSDKHALLQAADLLKPLNLSKDAELSEHIRSVLEEVLQVLGARKTRHLWN